MGFGNGGRSSSTFTSCHRQCDRRACRALWPSLACLVPIGRIPSPQSSLPHWIVSAVVSVAGGRLSMMGRRASTLSSKTVDPAFIVAITQRPGWSKRRDACVLYRCVRRRLDAAVASLHGETVPAISSGAVRPPLLSRRQYHPAAASRHRHLVHRAATIRIASARRATSKARATKK